MEKSQPIVDRLTQLDLERLSKLVSTIDSDPCTRVTIQTFRARILPLLANIGPNFDVVGWIEELSHPHCRLEVYDGEQLVYKLPSMVSQLETATGNSDRIFDHLDEYKALRADNPRFASNAMYAKLNSLSPEVDINKEAYEMYVPLINIFKNEGLAIPAGLEDFVRDYEQGVMGTTQAEPTPEVAVEPSKDEGGTLVYEDL